MLKRTFKVTAATVGFVALAIAPAMASPSPLTVSPVTFPYPGAAAGSSTLLTGIRTTGSLDTSQVYMSGVYKTSAGTQGLLYQGAVTGGGNWTLLNATIPGQTVTSTALYGPDNIGTTGINVVGSYKTVATGKLDHGLALSAPNGVSGAKTWTTLDATSLVTSGGNAWKAPAFTGKTITLTSKGPAVGAIQAALVARGFSIPGLGGPKAPLGTFGTRTQSALIAFQKSRPNLGPATGQVSGRLYSLLTSDSIKNTIAHSNRGGLVVGNFDTMLIAGRAFVTNLTGSSWFEITKPGAVSITAYGIWQNSTNNYTIAGGYFTPVKGSAPVEHGYLVTYNSVTKKLSNWASYDYQNRPAAVRITHFDGITPDGSGGYNLVGDWVGAGAVRNGLGFFAHVTPTVAGKYGTATWTQLKYPSSVVTSGNSVYENYAIGVYVNSGSSIVNPYLATIS